MAKPRRAPRKGERLGRALLLSLLAHGLLLLLLTAAQPDAPRSNQRQALALRLAVADGRRIERERQAADPVVRSTDASSPGKAKPEPADSSKETESAQPEPPLHFPNGALDRAAVPVSAPDPSRFLSDVDLPELPIRLRLFVDSHGKVTKIDILPPQHLDSQCIEAVKAMFMATRFIPGMIRGTRVPSYLDIEMVVSGYRR